MPARKPGDRGGFGAQPVGYHPALDAGGKEGREGCGRQHHHLREPQRARRTGRLRILQGARAEDRHQVEGRHCKQRVSCLERQVPQEWQGALGRIRRTRQPRGQPAEGRRHSRLQTRRPRARLDHLGPQRLGSERGHDHHLRLLSSLIDPGGCGEGSEVPTSNSASASCRRRHAIRVREPWMQIRTRRWSNVRLGRSILIAAVLTATMGSPVALALRSDRQSTTIAGGTFGTARAQCPGRRTAVSGGFAAPGFNPNPGPTVGRLGSKSVDKRGIETRALNFGNTAGDLVSFAYCAAHDHGLRLRSATTRVEPFTQGSAVARCPRGTEVVGGGFGTWKFDPSQGPEVLTLTSKRTGERGWKVVGVDFPANSGPGHAGTLVAHAYCEAARLKLVTRSKEVRPGAGALKTFDVPCPNGGRAFSGGFDGHVQIQGNQSKATATITSRRASGGHVWRSSALSIFGNPGPATAYAYCRER